LLEDGLGADGGVRYAQVVDGASRDRFMSS